MIVSQPVSGAVGSVVEAWDADLDAVAAVATTATGRSLLAIANGAAGRTILGAISAVATTSDGVLQIPLNGYLVATALNWTLTDQGSGIQRLRRVAAATTETVSISFGLPFRTTSGKGEQLNSVSIQFKVATAALNEITAVLSQTVLPANASAVAAGTSLSFTYDTGHDTTGERITVAEHTMVLTLSSPAYMADGLITLTLTVNAALTSVFDLKMVQAAVSRIPVDATA